ncbi:NYN domain-containing protein [Agrobacterium sp. CFBP2214]|uniref:NYN domain-containing protein n=1 Tax=Agrobacterium sp. CFBP2214 TaxID=3040274 RepID=UPI00101A43B7|nr:NYN domain-containing protein [Agrobacterium sp. CFBP2214]
MDAGRFGETKRRSGTRGVRQNTGIGTDRESPRLAVLIDADNVSSKIVDGLFGVVATLGDATVRRLYGDWTQANMRGWKSRLADHAIRPVQQFASCPGKNATDGAMIIDAMDLLHRNRLDGFCIVSSDGDFTRLAVRIREEGIAVHGFGGRQTPSSFIAACSSFTRFDRLRPSKEMRWLSATTADATQTAGRETDLSAHVEQQMLAMIEEAVSASREEDGWSPLAKVGLWLALHEPSFNPRHFGFAGLGGFVEACPAINVRRCGEGGHLVRVRLVENKVPTACEVTRDGA